MDSERWKRIEEVYYGVLACPAERRAAVLQEQCSGDPELLREVESLLEARDDAGDFLLAPAETTGFAPPEAGSTLGPYHLLALIGAGAMGEVFRASDSRLERQVALKVLPARFTSDASHVARFRLEAKAASALNHPNIVTIYEISEAGGTWCISEELIEGETLRQRLARGKLPIEEALSVTEQCVRALDAAHRAGIVHRDIKPENIMVRPDGVVKIVDFGLARISEAEGRVAPEATQTGLIMGTPRYMSPEQARGEKLDARTDIFSLGAVLYEMVTGLPAFPGKTAPEVFAALLSAKPGGEKTPDQANPANPVAGVLAKALAKNREVRYQSMVEMQRDLGAIDLTRPVAQRREKIAPATIRYGAIAAVLAAGVMLLWFRPWGARENAAETPLNLTPLTSFAGPKDFAAFSPDGERIAFSWTGVNPTVTTRHIFVKPVGAGDPRQLTEGAQDDGWPAWSPDGTTIAFARRVSGLERDILTVPSTGGRERKVARAGDGVSWSPDGKLLALADARRPDGFGGLFLLSLVDGTRRALTAPQNADSFPVFSSDGKWIAFLRQYPNPDVFLVPATGGPVRQLTSDGKPKLGGLTWTPDSREIVYSTQREYGGEGLWRVSAAGGTARRISSTLLFAGNPSICRKGNRLAYTESWFDTNIYRAEGPALTASGDLGPFGEAVKLVASSREDHSPNYSPDGQHLAFVSNRTGHSEVWTARADGSEQIQVTHFEGFTGTPRWSPDGRWIAFDGITHGNPDIFVVAATGGTPRRLTTDPGPDTKPSWSPDGDWIYFNSDRSGSPQVWKVRFDSGKEVQVTKNGGREALASADGRTIYYTKLPGGSPVWQVPAEGGEERPLTETESFDHVGRAWGILAQGLYFVSSERGSHLDFIRYFNFANRGVTTLGAWQARGRWTGPAIAISPDGRSLLTVRTDQEINDLMMIENFR